MPDDQNQPNPTEETNTPFPEIEPPTQPLQAATPQEVPQSWTPQTIAPVSNVPYTPAVSVPEETAVEPPAVPMPVAPKPIVPSPKAKKKGLLTAGIIVIVLVIIGSGTALAYTMWYQNPQKVITDALINAATAKTSIYSGVIDVSSDDYVLKLDVTTKQNAAIGGLDAKLTMTMDEVDYAIDANAVIDKEGDLYFKVEKLNELVKQYTAVIADSSPEYAARFEELAARIDGTWIRVSSNDLKAYSEDFATAKTCVNEAVAKFKDDTVAIDEIATLYKNNQFIVVDESLGSKDGSLGYKIEADSAATKAFAEGLKETTIYKSLNDCDETYTIDTSDFDTTSVTDTNNDGKVEIWVSRWTHTLTKISIKGESDGTSTSIIVNPRYDEPVTVETPEVSITIAELQNDIESIFAPTQIDPVTAN